ncbi:MAG: LptF/LptG family permease [Candidatus Omnitrophica bacterium]|nr:LptF/LptG family permease [Candidatus Omnitrophota bacterium]MCM8791310.1 LptF/LptG family permease [Candidatus Omnitrophota bacterium]
MRILRDYILKDFLHSFSLSIIVFTFVLLVGNIIRLADLVINKGVDMISVLKLFFYLIPWLLSFTLPVAALTGVILTFGRLSSDGELIAMKASGISLYRIASPVIMIGIIFSFVAFILNDQISSNASFASRKVIKEIGIKSPAAYLEESTFIRGFENYVIFIYEIRGNKFKNIRIYQPQEGKPTRTIVAESGEINTDPKRNIVELQLFNGTSEEPSPTDPQSFYKLNFKTYFMSLDLNKIFKKEKIEKKTREMSINELRDQINQFIAQKIDPTPLYVEIYKKVNMSVASFVLVLIGIPLGIRAHRSEKSIGFGISLILFALYWGAFLGGVALALKGTMPPALGVSLPNAVFLILGLILFAYTARR